MARAQRLALVVCSVPLGLAVLIAASGWLYLARSHLGTSGAVHDALPLDELPGHASVSVIVFLAVWGAAAVLLALLARALGAERLTAAFVLALAVGSWVYVSTGASIFVVRQIPLGQAFHLAGRAGPVYLSAGLAGLAGAVLCRAGRPGGGRAPVVLAWLVAAAAALDVLTGVLPHKRNLVGELAPRALAPLASALVAPTGLVLLLVARGLARRKRRAWHLAIFLLGASAVLHLLHRFPYGAIVTGLLALALVARRSQFDAQGDPEAKPRVALRLVLSVGAIYAYGAAALWANRMVADRPYTLAFAARETTEALLGQNGRASSHLTGEFGGWFPLSVLLLGLTAVAALLVSWLGPWRHRVRHGTLDRELARALVAEWGSDTLAPFALRADKSYFFSVDRHAFLAYRVVGGVAIVSGDPVGPAEALDRLVLGFIEFAHGRDWRIAILGASERCLGLYREHGLHTLYHGDEAVVETASFSLEGRAIRKVRQSVHRLQRAGYRVEVLRPSAIDDKRRAELEAIVRGWRGDEPQRGFTMALDALFRLGDGDAIFVIGFGADGVPRGFLHFAVSRAGSALSLSSMPRLRDTPNGFNEWLVCEAVSWAHANGFARVSLNFAPFAAIFTPGAALSPAQRLERRVLMQLKGRFQLDNLLVFNRKFFPAWERRFVVYERRRDLPRVGIAALAAEAYLPFSGRAEA
jgi:lysyl-tRNA synthetase, class II